MELPHTHHRQGICEETAVAAQQHDCRARDRLHQPAQAEAGRGQYRTFLVVGRRSSVVGHEPNHQSAGLLLKSKPLPLNEDRRPATDDLFLSVNLAFRLENGFNRDPAITLQLLEKAVLPAGVAGDAGLVYEKQ